MVRLWPQRGCRWSYRSVFNVVLCSVVLCSSTVGPFSTNVPPFEPVLVSKNQKKIQVCVGVFCLIVECVLSPVDAIFGVGRRAIEKQSTQPIYLVFRGTKVDPETETWRRSFILYSKACARVSLDCVVFLSSGVQLKNNQPSRSFSFSQDQEEI